MLIRFVNGHSPPEKQVQLKRKVASLDDSLPPHVLPANGVEYGVEEIISIIQTYKRRSKQCGAMITKTQSTGYIYLKRLRRSVYCIIAARMIKDRFSILLRHDVIWVGPKS
jgi:hypothetical protein